MLIKDIAIYFRNGIISTIAKAGRLEIPAEMKSYIEKNHLYHVTSDFETAEKIANSEYLKPASGIDKNINSYGTAATCMFAGTPNIEDYMKNLTDYDLDKNPYLNPTMIANAVQIDIKQEELKNYKIRGLADNAIICEGYTILPNQRVKAVQLVPDLIRGENGKPLLDEKTGKPLGIRFRERTEQEMIQSPNEYFPSSDYLEFVNQKRIEYGYSNNKNIFSKGYNLIKTLKHEGEIEGNSTIENIRKNFIQTIKDMFNKATRVTIDENTDEKINRIMDEFNFDKKNPYRDKKFGLAVAKFQQQGLTQLDFKEELSALELIITIE